MRMGPICHTFSSPDFLSVSGTLYLRLAYSSCKIQAYNHQEAGNECTNELANISSSDYNLSGKKVTVLVVSRTSFLT